MHIAVTDVDTFTCAPALTHMNTATTPYAPCPFPFLFPTNPSRQYKNTPREKDSEGIEWAARTAPHKRQEDTERTASRVGQDQRAGLGCQDLLEISSPQVPQAHAQ